MTIPIVDFNAGVDVTERKPVTDVMADGQAYSTKEIAEALGIHTASARQRLIRAHEKNEVLRKRIEGKTYWAKSGQ